MTANRKTPHPAPIATSEATDAASAAATTFSFTDLKLSAPVLQSLRELGYEAAYPIQATAIPPLIEGRDLLGQAQTGTGKTAAFALPILTRLDLTRKHPQALVLTPTRELALQVAEAMQTYARHLPGFHVLPVYGGQPFEGQLRQLQRGVHVVVGTPGRLLDHLRRKTLRLDALQSVVIDEADEMLRMGFIDEVEAILEHTPAEKQVALFSATFPPAITRIAKRYLKDPVEVRIESPTSTVAATTQRYWLVAGTHKLDALTRILEAEEFEAMLVFVRTRIATEELAEKLEARGYSAAALSGELTQAQREKTIERLRAGTLDIVVATDVAARGLDVDRISHVINYDVPFDAEAYVHRIGRTGRAGRKGTAILFIAPREQRMLAAIERATRQSITPMRLPSREDIADRRVTRFKDLLRETLETKDLGFFRDIVTGYQRDTQAAFEDIAAGLAFLAQRGKPLQPVVEPTPARPARPDSAPGVRPPRTPRPGSGDRPTAPHRAEGKAGAQRGPSMDRPPAADRERYRLEVGSSHGVEVRNIVGALANEAQLESRDIGPVKLFDTYTLVDLPAGMPRQVHRHLSKVWVGGRQLGLRLISDAASPVTKDMGTPTSSTHAAPSSTEARPDSPPHPHAKHKPAAGHDHPGKPPHPGKQPPVAMGKRFAKEARFAGERPFAKAPSFARSPAHGKHAATGKPPHRGKKAKGPGGHKPD